MCTKSKTVHRKKRMPQVCCGMWRLVVFVVLQTYHSLYLSLCKCKADRSPSHTFICILLFLLYLLFSSKRRRRIESLRRLSTGISLRMVLVHSPTQSDTTDCGPLYVDLAKMPCGHNSRGRCDSFSTSCGRNGNCHWKLSCVQPLFYISAPCEKRVKSSLDIT